jgi:uncharacterized RDD family membrane protein YckC/ribosomal protein S27AE
MPTTFDMIWRNAALQEHWIRRFFAFVIDFVIVLAIGFLIGIPLGFVGWVLAWFSPLFIGAIWFFYSALLETFLGSTVGKKIFALHVVAIGQNLDFVHAIVRNATKIYVPLVFIDFLVGIFMHGDPRQRLFDRIAGTTVTRVDQGAYMEEQFRMMQQAGPHPMTMPPAPAPQAPPPAPPGSQAAPGAGGWPGQTQAPSGGPWPSHKWDEQGNLVKEMRFCTACGGQLVARGDGKLACVRCGAVY